MIKTREHRAGITGDGTELFALSLKQVHIICSYLSITLMHNDGYGEEVMNLMDLIETKYGIYFMDDMIETTGMKAHLLEDGTFSVQRDIPADLVTLEFE